MSGKIILEITRNFVCMKLKVNQGFRICFHAILKGLKSLFNLDGVSALARRVQVLKRNMTLPYA